MSDNNGNFTKYDLGVIAFKHFQGHEPVEILNVPQGTKNVMLDCGHSVEILAHELSRGSVHLGIHGETLIIAEEK